MICVNFTPFPDNLAIPNGWQYPVGLFTFARIGVSAKIAAIRIVQEELLPVIHLLGPQLHQQDAQDV
jgi:hypothetical protein